MMSLPPMKAPAGLYLKPETGKGPRALGYENAWMFGAFGDLAYLLAHLTPEKGDVFWIESTTGKLTHDDVKDAFAVGAIQRVN